MKKVLTVFLLTISLSVLGDDHHGHHGHHGGGYGYQPQRQERHEHHGGGWIAPLIGGAILGGVVSQYYRPPVVIYQDDYDDYVPQYGSPVRNRNIWCDAYNRWQSIQYYCPSY